jgi:hypothetical protein
MTFKNPKKMIRTSIGLAITAAGLAAMISNIW